VTRLYADDAELYDIAFDWDISDEVTWLLERLGPDCRTVLEPGCGSGRMLEPFARRGIEITGIDNSPAMLALARRRLDAAGLRAQLLEADMVEFDLGRTFDGAINPINTLGHLGRDELARHLDCVARHLEPAARYLVQVGLIEPEMEHSGGSSWQAGRGDTKLEVSWNADFDFERGVSHDRSRIEVLEGPRAGEVIEETHLVTVWSPQTWPRLIEASPFTQLATYDGNQRDRPPVGPEATGGLLWHELVRSSP
jgi:SAM-dependent methyltransferase